MVAAGRMLGADQKVVLHLLDIPPAAKALEGVRMELLDAAFPLLEGELLLILLLAFWGEAPAKKQTTPAGRNSHAPPPP